MKRTKRMVSLILTLLMIVSMIPLSTVTSGAAGGVKKKLDSFITSYPSGSRWTGSFDGGSQCYGFGKMVVYNLFGKNSSGGYRSWTYAGVSTSGMNVIGSVTSFSSANVKSLLSKAKCGDILQFNTTKQHTMVVYSVDSGGVTVYDCNWDNNCGISKRYCSFGAWSGRNSSKLTLLRADNYDKIDGPAVSHTVDTKYGKNFTAYLKNPSGQTPVYDANHALVSGRYISGNDPCTIHEVYTDGCCKVSYITDSGVTRTYYTKYSYFKPSQLTVYYNANGGTVTSDTYKLTNKFIYEISTNKKLGQVWEYNSPKTNGLFNAKTFGLTRTGYTFTGWGTTASGGTVFDQDDTSLVPTKINSAIKKGNCSTTLYAIWTPNKLTVNYNANGGTVTSDTYKLTNKFIYEISTNKKLDQVWEYNSPKTNGLVNAKTFGLTRTGYTFTGWGTTASGGTVFDQDDTSLVPTKINSAIKNGNCSSTLYAIWKANSYTVQYNANGGTGTTANSSHTYDTAKALTANGFTRTGYTFLGWSTSASATTATYKDKQSVKNLTSTNGGTVTLYAVWQKNPVTVSSIAVQTLPAKMTYTVGDKFDASGLTIKATMSDGTTKTLTSGFTVSAPDMSTAGKKTVTVSYGGKTATFTITVKAPVVLSSISVQTLPTKTTYTVGDKFDASGLTIKATMSDGTVKTLSSGFTVSAPDMTTAGTKTVTVSYGGKTTTFSITVKAPVPPVGTAALRLDVPTHAVVGQKIQIPVMLENASIGTLMFTVKYDATKLKYVSNAEPAFDMCDTNSATAGIFKAACIDNATVPAGKVIVLTFEVIAPDACSTNLVLTVEEAYDGKDNPVSMVGGAWEMQIVKSVPGDVNGDGRVTAIDARWVLQAASGARTLDNAQSIAADVNGDGKVSAIDARWILQVASGSRKL